MVALIWFNRITWVDRHSKPCQGKNCSVAPIYDPSQPSTSLWGSVAMLGLNATIDISVGISSYVVDYVTGASTHVHATNGGSGFPMQDVVIWQYPQSCRNGNTITIVAAVSSLAGINSNTVLNHRLGT